MIELDDDAILVALSTAEVTIFIRRATRSIVTYSCARLHIHNTVARPLLMATPEMYRVLRCQRYRAFYDRVVTAVRGEQKQPPADADDWTDGQHSVRRGRATCEKWPVVRRCSAVNTRRQNCWFASACVRCPAVHISLSSRRAVGFLTVSCSHRPSPLGEGTDDGSTWEARGRLTADWPNIRRSDRTAIKLNYKCRRV